MHVVNEVMVRASYKLALQTYLLTERRLYDNGGRRYR